MKKSIQKNFKRVLEIYETADIKGIWLSFCKSTLNELYETLKNTRGCHQVGLPSFQMWEKCGRLENGLADL